MRSLGTSALGHQTASFDSATLSPNFDKAALSAPPKPGLQNAAAMHFASSRPGGSSQVTSLQALASAMEKTVSAFDALHSSTSSHAKTTAAAPIVPKATAAVAPAASVITAAAAPLINYSAPTATSSASPASAPVMSLLAPSIGTSGGTAQPAGIGGTGRAGTEATVVDLGMMEINGVKNFFGAVQGPYVGAKEAASMIAGSINQNAANSVTASVTDDGRLSLTSKDGASGISIKGVGESTAGGAYKVADIGLANGSFGSTVTAATSVRSELLKEDFSKSYSTTAGTDMSAAPPPASPAPAPTQTATPAPGALRRSVR